MAKILNGVLGASFGKIGPIVTYEWKDIPCMRSLPTPSKRPPSDAQVKSRTRFGYASTFLSPMKGLIKETFKEYASKMTEFNNAVSYTTKNAISGSYPDFRIHYDRLLLSRGSLPNADDPMAQEDNGFLHFSWKDNSGLGKAASTDKALLICYFPGMNVPYHTTEAALRGDETATLDLSKLKGYLVHTWVAFMAADNSTANSVYTGAFTLGGERPVVVGTNTNAADPVITAAVTARTYADSPVNDASINESVSVTENLPIQQDLDFQIILQSPDKGTEYALQKGHGPNVEPVQRQQAFNKEPVFRFRIGIQKGKDGLPDFTGPFVQGPPGERFICICTGAYAGQKYTSTGRRLKILLDNISWELIRKLSEQKDRVLQAVVAGKSESGAPVSETIHSADGWTLATETKT